MKQRKGVKREKGEAKGSCKYFIEVPHISEDGVPLYNVVLYSLI